MSTERPNCHSSLALMVPVDSARCNGAIYTASAGSAIADAMHDGNDFAIAAYRIIENAAPFTGCSYLDVWGHRVPFVVTYRGQWALIRLEGEPEPAAWNDEHYGARR